MNVLVLIHSPFVMWTIPPGHVARLQEAFPHHTFLHARGEAEGEQLIPDAEIAFSAQITRKHLMAAGRLRWIHSPSAGVGSMLFPEMLQSPVIITNGRGVSAGTIAEHVLAVTLALLRRLPLALTRQSEATWAQDEIGAPPGNRMLSGARALIVGLGAIGSATAVRLHCLGAVVTAVRRRTGLPAPAGVSHVGSAGDLRDLLPSADLVVLTAPQTAETRGLIGEAELRLMKPDAILVNVSRGGLLDERALAAALQERRLAGAALDVFQDEPLRPDDPLWKVPNLLITPHTSGYRTDHWDAAISLFSENLRRFERGGELLNVVDKQQGY